MKPWLALWGGVLVFCLVLPLPVRSQDLGWDLERLTEQNAGGYSEPAATSIGIGLNSGMIRTARIHDPLGFDLSLNMSVIRFPASARKYTYDTSWLSNISLNDIVIDRYEIPLDFGKVYPPVEGAPTVVGRHKPPLLVPDKTYAEEAIVTSLVNQSGLSANEVRVQYAADIQKAIAGIQPLDLIIGGWLHSNNWVIPSLQVGVGLPLGTEVQVRYFPSISFEEKGKVSLFGLGGRIDLDQFIPIPFFPIDMAGGALFQRMQFGVVKIRSNIYHLEASKRLPVVTLYGGVGFETTKMSAYYPFYFFNLWNLDIHMAIRGKNRFRGTLGVQARLSPLLLTFDYSLIGSYRSMTFGLGLSFR